MEIESKKKTYSKRRKSNKRNRKVARHRNGNHGVMNKHQLREFFGHKFGATEVSGFIAPLLRYETPFGDEIDVSFIADKNDNICDVNEGFIVEAGLVKRSFDKEDIVIVMNIYRGQNLCLVAESGRVVQ
jgi:hypothetical protein